MNTELKNEIEVGINSLINSCEKVLSTEVSFSEESPNWMSVWSIRSGYVASVEKKHKSLEPLIKKWKKIGSSYSVYIQKEISTSIDKLISVMMEINNQNKVLYESAAAEREIVKSKLQNLRKSTKAIACYTHNS